MKYTAFALLFCLLFFASPSHGEGALPSPVQTVPAEEPESTPSPGNGPETASFGRPFSPSGRTPGEILYEETGTLYSLEEETISLTITSCRINGTECYLTFLRVQDPARQITKETARWREDLMDTAEMAGALPDCVLAINASGYVTSVFRKIPDAYPGTSEDYYFTPLGSLTVTHGQVLRNLEGVPYYGLTLEEDGLHVYYGADNEAVLQRGVLETWSFYEDCPLILDHTDIVPESWFFASARAARNIVFPLGPGRIGILTVTSFRGLSLFECVDFLQRELDPEWAYNLDGGPSAALIFRKAGESGFTMLYPNRQKNADIMAFLR